MIKKCLHKRPKVYKSTLRPTISVEPGFRPTEMDCLKLWFSSVPISTVQFTPVHWLTSSLAVFNVLIRVWIQLNWTEQEVEFSSDHFAPVLSELNGSLNWLTTVVRTFPVQSYLYAVSLFSWHPHRNRDYYDPYAHLDYMDHATSAGVHESRSRNGLHRGIHPILSAA